MGLNTRCPQGHSVRWLCSAQQLQPAPGVHKNPHTATWPCSPAKDSSKALKGLWDADPKRETPQKGEVLGGLAGTYLLLQPADFASDSGYRKAQNHFGCKINFRTK